MSRFARKQRRLESQRFDLLFDLAEQSLCFSDAQMMGDREQLADAVTARVYELMEILDGPLPAECSDALAELEARNGAGFLARVAAMGEPARDFADRIRYIM